MHDVELRGWILFKRFSPFFTLVLYPLSYLYQIIKSREFKELSLFSSIVCHISLHTLRFMPYSTYTTTISNDNFPCGYFQDS